MYDRFKSCRKRKWCGDKPVNAHQFAGDNQAQAQVFGKAAGQVDDSTRFGVLGDIARKLQVMAAKPRPNFCAAELALVAGAANSTMASGAAMIIF